MAKVGNLLTEFQDGWKPTILKLNYDGFVSGTKTHLNAWNIRVPNISDCQVEHPSVLKLSMTDSLASTMSSELSGPCKEELYFHLSHNATIRCFIHNDTK